MILGSTAVLATRPQRATQVTLHDKPSTSSQTQIGSHQTLCPSKKCGQNTVGRPRGFELRLELQTTKNSIDIPPASFSSKVFWMLTL